MYLRSAYVGLFLSALACGASAASNYASCLLETLPGTQSRASFNASIQLCAEQHRDQFFTLKRGFGRGALAYRSANACTSEKAKTTLFQPAAQHIRMACDCLYSEPRGEWDMCQRYQLPDGVREQHGTSKTIAEQIELEHHYRRIYALHPDADEIFARRDFQAWWAGDPAKVQVLTNGSTQEVIKLIAAFKADLAARPGPWGEADTPIHPSTR